MNIIRRKNMKMCNKKSLYSYRPRNSIKENHHQGLQQVQSRSMSNVRVRLIFSLHLFVVLYDVRRACLTNCMFFSIYILSHCAITSFYLVYHLKVQTINISLYECNIINIFLTSLHSPVFLLFIICILRCCLCNFCVEDRWKHGWEQRTFLMHQIRYTMMFVAATTTFTPSIVHSSGHFFMFLPLILCRFPHIFRLCTNIG